MPGLLKVSSQGQVTLLRAIRARMENPPHLKAELAFSKHGITRAVLQEALRIAARQEREGSGE